MKKELGHSHFISIGITKQTSVLKNQSCVPTLRNIFSSESWCKEGEKTSLAKYHIDLFKYLHVPT